MARDIARQSERSSDVRSQGQTSRKWELWLDRSVSFRHETELKRVDCCSSFSFEFFFQANRICSNKGIGIETITPLFSSTQKRHPFRISEYCLRPPTAIWADPRGPGHIHRINDFAASRSSTCISTLNRTNYIGRLSATGFCISKPRLLLREVGNTIALATPFLFVSTGTTVASKSS